MYFIKRLFAFLTLLIAFSCNDSTQLGLNFIDEGKRIVTQFVDSLKIETSIVHLDSIKTSGVSRLLVGKYYNPDYGTVSAKSYVQPIYLSEGSPIISGSEPEYVSMSLMLANSYAYGDTSVSQNFLIHELAEDIDTIDYYQFNELNIVPEPIGSYEYSLSQADTSFIEISLANSFGERVFSDLIQNDATTQEGLLQALKGIRVSTDDSETSPAVYGFDTNNGLSKFQIRFRTQNSDGTYDTLRRELPLIGRRFNSINYDLEGTLSDFNENSDAIISTSNFQNKGIVLSGTPMTTKLSFPSSETLSEVLGATSLIDKAELVISPVERRNTTILNPPAELRFKLIKSNSLVRDENGNPEIIFEDGYSPIPQIPATFRYNANAGNYFRADVTDYIQKLLRNEISSELALASANEALSINQVSFFDANADINSDSSFYNTNLKLEIYFSRTAE